MMASKACAQAHVLMAGLAEVVGSLASSGLLAADYAVGWHVYERRVMIHGQCSCTGMTSSSALRPSLGRQTLHEFVSELHAEGEVRFIGMLHLPQPERIENADVEQPPHQARPALAALPTWQVGVVKLIDHIHSAGVMEVVSNGLRAAELIDGAIVAPALHGSELLGINVVVQQQDELLVAPGTESDIVSLHLQVSAAWDGSEPSRGQLSC